MFVLWLCSPTQKQNDDGGQVHWTPKFTFTSKIVVVIVAPLLLHSSCSPDHFEPQGNNNRVGESSKKRLLAVI